MRTLLVLGFKLPWELWANPGPALGTQALLLPGFRLFQKQPPGLCSPPSL